MNNNFDFIAAYYDQLARLVYGSAIKNSQIENLKLLNSADHVLIVGGGTGWILEEIDNLNIELDITYVDSSEKMISKSKERNLKGQLNVNFVCCDVNDMPENKFNVIITNFFLDVFSEENLYPIMNSLKERLKSNGVWLFTDFSYTNNIYHKMLLKIMFWFFKLTTNLESRYLPNFDQYFNSLGMNKSHLKFYYSGMIQSAVYS